MSKTIEGANAITNYIYGEYVEQDTLVRLYHDAVLVAQFLTVIDDYQVDYFSDDLTDDEAEALTDEEWDTRAEMITIWGESIEAVEFDGGLETEIRFIVDDPDALIANIDKGSAHITAGGDWALNIMKLREPVRHKTHELVEKSRQARRRLEDGEGV